MIPSPYQSAVYTWIREGTGNASLIAVAGSGKTTTIVDALAHIPREQSVRLFSFGKDIAETLQARTGQFRNVEASTYNSSGHRALLRELHAKHIAVDPRKSWTLVRAHLSREDEQAYGEQIVRLIGLAKNAGVGALVEATPETWQTLAKDLEFDWIIPPEVQTDAEYLQFVRAERARVLELAQSLLTLSNAAARAEYAWSIDFDDQLYLPILWNLKLPIYDWVLLDEAQDTNAIQREYVRRACHEGTRLIIVGDPNQSIYVWRGASTDAMELLGKAFTTIILPLSVCYRCPKSVVRLAQTLVPEIEAWEESPEGEVDDAASVSKLSTLGPKDVILCRNRAPLIERAYALIAAGVPCRVLGTDIGRNLKSLMRRLKPTSPTDLLQKLIRYEQDEARRYALLHEEWKVEAMRDRVQCLRVITEEVPEAAGLAGVTAAIDDLFADTITNRITLSTIHKAKGKQWKTVAILKAWLMPSRYAVTPVQIQQEQNLRYVAYTRAQERLWIMDDEPDWMRKKREGRDRERKD